MEIKRTYRDFAAHVAVGILLIGLATSRQLFAQELRAPVAPLAYKAVAPANRNLDATLYVQTAAEYRAACYQAYNLAISRLKEKLHNQLGSKPPAVIMDLDETVFDNSGFRAMLVRSGLDYDQRLWDSWEQHDSNKVALIPGAKEFILEANNLGISVVFVSGRKSREEIKKIFERFRIPLADDARLKLTMGSGNKTKCFLEVQHDYTVLLYIGDNLRDFDNNLRCGDLGKGTDDKLDGVIKARKAAVDKDRAKFGVDWIIMPNPMYGEWTKPLERGEHDLDRLVPESTKR